MDARVKMQIKRIANDISQINIQGATNVAYAVVSGLELFLKSSEIKDKKSFKKEFIEVGRILSEARENEPMARNAFKYIFQTYKQTKSLQETIKSTKDYFELINSAKEKMIVFGSEKLMNYDVILTHCHSSSVEKILENVNNVKQINSKKKLQVVATETRPLYQGRKTSAKLFKKGVDVTLIVDNAAGSFILDKNEFDIGCVIIGCDELLKDGSFINKVGSIHLALATLKDKDKLFVATSLLKLDFSKDPQKAKIEKRDAKEIWEDAPKGLKIVNPAFDQIDAEFVSGYITEAGVLTKEDLVPSAKRLYPWMFEKK